MEKTVNIGGKDYRLRSSLYTIIDYKSTFGSDLFEDISKLSDGKGNITQVVQVLFQIVYILSKPFSKKSYEEFLGEFDFSVITDQRSLEQITEAIGEFLSQSKSQGAQPAAAGKANP